MSVGFLFSGVLGHLPLLAVLVAGFVLIATRRAWLGPRSVLLARLGLAALALSSLLQLAWTMLIPTLYSTLDYSMMRYSLLISVSGLVTSLISAAGVGLLIAAVVSRSPGPAFSGPPPTDGPPFPGPPPTDGPPFPGPPYQGSQPYGAGDQPAGPPFA
jgi:hypothetical protein